MLTEINERQTKEKEKQRSQNIKHHQRKIKERIVVNIQNLQKIDSSLKRFEK